MTNKITERAIYTMMLEGNFDPEIMKTFAERKLAQVDKRNKAAKAYAAKKRAASNEMLETVFSYLTKDGQTRSEIVNAMISNGIDTTVSKVGARLNILVSDGRVVKDKVKVSGEDGKTKFLTTYALAQ